MSKYANPCYSADAFARGQRGPDGSPYWDGEREGERVLRELLEQRRLNGLSIAVNLILSIALLLFAVAFVWLCAAM